MVKFHGVKFKEPINVVDNNVVYKKRDSQIRMAWFWPNKIEKNGQKFDPTPLPKLGIYRKVSGLRFMKNKKNKRSDLWKIILFIFLYR